MFPVTLLDPEAFYKCEALALEEKNTLSILYLTDSLVYTSCSVNAIVIFKVTSL